MNALSLCLVCTSPFRKQRADDLARQTGLPLLDERSDDFDLQLCFDDDRVSLYDTALKTSIHVDFVAGALAHRQRFGGGRGQAIARAVGFKQSNNPVVLDITAGLARDAYVLASLGCKLTLVERSPILYALIQDGIDRGLNDATVAAVLQNFIELVNADSIEYMQQLDRKSRPDVIYIDPMYPQRKKSARVKKDMQILQRLLGKTHDDGRLLEAALTCAARRVVVKRPLHAEPLGNIKPDTQICGRKTRYDIYLKPNASPGVAS